MSGDRGGGAGRGKRRERGVGGYIAPRVPATREAPVTAMIVGQGFQAAERDDLPAEKKRALRGACVNVRRVSSASDIWVRRFWDGAKVLLLCCGCIRLFLLPDPVLGQSPRIWASAVVKSTPRYVR